MLPPPLLHLAPPRAPLQLLLAVKPSNRCTPSTRGAAFEMARSSVHR
jgi:hypothetical protein